MTLQVVIYYVGFAAAILLCRGLGRLFFYPMLLNVGFNISLNLGLFGGWDVRWLIVAYGFGIFLWVLALTGAWNRTLFVGLLLLDLAVIMNGLWPVITVAGNGVQFWNYTSTAIIDVWMISILVVVLSTVVKSTLIARFKGKFVDLLTNPKKRFVLPIGAWACIIESAKYLPSFLPSSVVANRFDIAAQVLVWGWVGLELPFLLTHRRLKRQIS